MKHLLVIAMLAPILAPILALAPASALAQPTDPNSAAKLPIARKLYDEGVDAINKGRWSTAYDKFKASYELVPRPLTLFNLAAAQSQTGRLVEASESYRRFLRDTSDGRLNDERENATSQLEQLDKQIAQVTIEVAHLESDDIILIDEIEFPHSALHTAIPMNPGQHVARVQRGQNAIANRKITLVSGATESVQIDLPIAQPDLNVRRDSESAAPGVTGTSGLTRRTEPAPADGERSWLRSPWLWAGVAVVVGGAAVGTYMLTRSPDGVTIR
jgi:tetratricopeptide (TPR) repeat protein